MKRRNPESGFAMLMVFVLAAAIAITLYMEIPRVVFESERAKEQILVDRGNQYKRAIQLYHRRIHNYPAKIDDLESTNNIRFLRHRYKDPLTGKDEWRLIHIGPTGQLTDSLIQKADPLKNDKDKDKNLNASNAPTGSTGDPNTGADPRALWANGRPSDKVLTGVNGGPPPAPEDPNAPPQPPQPQYPSGQPPYPGQPGYPQQPTGQPQYPGQPGYQPTGQPQYPGQPGFPQIPVGQPGFAPQPFPNQPYNPLQPNQSFNPGQPGQPNTAANIISQILTTPRQPPAGLGYPAPGGYPPRYDANGNLLPPGPSQQPGQPPPPSNPGSGFAFNNTGITANTGGIPSNSLGGGGAGIAGVASTASGSGIMVINDRQKFKEWEFVYDITKDKTVVGGVPNQQLPNQQPQNPLQQNPPVQPVRRLPGSGQ
jgi:type II secretory pathway pseudopilin PulG